MSACHTVEPAGPRSTIREPTAALSVAYRMTLTGEQVLELARSGDLQHDVIGRLFTEVDHLESRVAQLEYLLANSRTAPTASG